MKILHRFTRFLKNLSIPQGRKTAPDAISKPKDTQAPHHDVAAPLVVRQNEEHDCAAYTDLKKQFRDIGRIGAVAETLGRDFLTAMPEGAWKSRLSQIAYMHRLMHEKMTDRTIAGQIDRAKSHLENNNDNWDEWDRANLQEIERSHRRAACIDGELTETEARLAYEGRRHHRNMLAAGDWMQAREFLSRTIDMKCRVADATCRATGKNSAYDVLLDEFMPGVSQGDLEGWFKTIKTGFDKILPQALEKQSKESEPLPITDYYPAKAQMWLNRALLKAIDFDFERGGLYETGHNPVEGGTPDDTRLVISTADTSNFMDSLKSTLHEGGHGLYIQGLPRKTWRYQPVAQDMGAAMQESQALLIDMIVGRSPAFFEFLSPRMEGLFHGLKNPVLSARNLYKLRTQVKPTMVRRKADEITYFYHILHRFRLERDLIGRRLKVADLPEAWNAGMEDLLGVQPQSYAEGCLQDVHWFVGKFGYFPSYATGHMLAAQQFAALSKDIPNIDAQIASGDFLPLTNWLRENIHQQGRVKDMDTLMKNATGSNITPKHLLSHIENRYVRAA